jgi:hypothetical protein
MLGLVIPGVFLVEFLEIGCVNLVFNFGSERSIFFSDALPVDSLEEGVRFDLWDAIDAKTLVGIRNEFSDQIDGRLKNQN